jgi:hypothetical protein
MLLNPGIKSLENKHIQKTKPVRIKCTVVPWIKLNERMKRTFFNSKPKILIVVPFSRSCSVNLNF